MPVDRDTFVEIMASYPAGVAIVTTLDADGTPRGLTTTAVSSVSAEPPLLLVCVDLTSRTLPALRAGGRFVVNFLREGRSELARLFASKSDDKFDQVEWRPTASGMPFLPADALAWAECVTVHEIEPGDHVVLLGQVEEGAGAADEDAPLMYYRRSWGVWKPAPRQIESRQITAIEVSGQDLLWEGAELSGKCGITLCAKSSWFLIACQWSKPPGLTVIEISVSPSQTSRTASMRSITSGGHADPDDVAGDHLVVRGLGQLFEDAGGVKAVAGAGELVRGWLLVFRERRRVAGEEALDPGSASRRAVSRSSSR